jgi:hypothetical protein
MTSYEAVAYSFFFGLLHGALPDEHTWPITLSYALGTARGREGMKAGLYFSTAFTVQRMILAEASYLALAPFLLNPAVNRIVYIVVGAAMTLAGALVLSHRPYPHLHLLGRHGEEKGRRESEDRSVSHPLPGLSFLEGGARALPLRWTLIHGFIAGFGVGGFALFVNTVAVPAMRSPWLGFAPGLAFGIGTTVVLVVIGGLFGHGLRFFRWLTPEQITGIGREVGARTLFFGGIFFAALGGALWLGLGASIPDKYFGTLTILVFLFFIFVPALVFSLRRARAARSPSSKGGEP